MSFQHKTELNQLSSQKISKRVSGKLFLGSNFVVYFFSNPKNNKDMKGKNHKNVCCKNSIIYKNLPMFRAGKPYFVRHTTTLLPYLDEVRFACTKYR